MFNKNKNRTFIIEEKDVTFVISIVNKNRKSNRAVNIGNCGWANEEESKWFINFTANDKVYGEIINELSMNGVVNLNVRPNVKYADLYFERKVL